jgi:hypothetical protein
LSTAIEERLKSTPRDLLPAADGQSGADLPRDIMIE